MRKNKKITKKLRHKYRLALYNDQHYGEVWQTRLTPLNVMGMFGIIGLIVVAGVIMLVAFTPLREFIPGYPDSKTRAYIISNALRLDSLQRQIQQWTLYNDNISRILSGQEPINVEDKSPSEISQRYKDIVLKRSRADSIFRLHVENIDASSFGNDKNSYDKIENLRFVAPLWGEIEQTFAPHENRYGITIHSILTLAAAAADGMVVAAYPSENGSVIVLQHGYNVITIYKNLIKTTVKVGKIVRCGDYIGLTNKNHNASLVFEIWYNGSAVDPENYIRFH